MKTTIKLVLIYLGAQILSSMIVLIPNTFYNISQGNSLDTVSSQAIAITMFLGFFIMGGYLWKAGYISTDKRTWSPVSGIYLVFTTLIWLASIIILEHLFSLLPEIPNLLKSDFDTLQSGWLGILSIALFGPILEELMFRGAIMRALLKKYNPTKAIILSALIFGIIHFNPAQIVAGAILGLLLGWIYYKTASLIPCILIHILNNSLSVYLNLKYPDVEYAKDLFTGNTYSIVLIAAIIIFVGSILWMKQVTIPFPWKEERVEEHYNEVKNEE
ncbi:CPBP family intramembrane glutamic endopeptidase [Bacteroides sp. 51]|uniref:CPBP family intramembrane glutamic endopeptidase n=1 Tax=Bacteroides sp. 51 TaxID=2302938 RepID=UPI0013D55747|nr:type II CAAX endopeptidase family protein [Bacteroides sp. 51]NDV82201.1 CPBP family intramembrane metalloprotease [Bacteroides sp. 51]